MDANIKISNLQETLYKVANTVLDVVVLLVLLPEIVLYNFITGILLFIDTMITGLVTIKDTTSQSRWLWPFFTGAWVLKALFQALSHFIMIIRDVINLVVIRYALMGVTRLIRLAIKPNISNCKPRPVQVNSVQLLEAQLRWTNKTLKLFAYEFYIVQWTIYFLQAINWMLLHLLIEPLLQLVSSAINTILDGLYTVFAYVEVSCADFVDRQCSHEVSDESQSLLSKPKPRLAQTNYVLFIILSPIKLVASLCLLLKTMTGKVLQVAQCIIGVTGRSRLPIREAIAIPMPYRKNTGLTELIGNGVSIPFLVAQEVIRPFSEDARIDFDNAQNQSPCDQNASLSKSR